MYKAENKAHFAITMCLPMEILHTFRSYKTAKELWDALVRRYRGNDQVRENRKELLKTQFMFFKYMKNETLEELINRFYHLMTELDNNYVSYTDLTKNNKLLNALPPKWDLYSVMLKENASYSTWTLEDVIGKLRAYDLNMQQKETSSDVAQNPELYHGKKTTSNASLTRGVTAFFLGETDIPENPEVDVSYSYIASSSNDGKGRTPSNGNTGNVIKLMPMSIKSTEGHVAMLASFIVVSAFSCDKQHSRLLVK